MVQNPLKQPLESSLKPEYRAIRMAHELRAEEKAGKRYLTGYAATYNVLSSDLGGFVERVMPGAFTRSLKEGQDVRHLINHDPNLVLGRTKAGTTVLTEDSTGLRFHTLLPEVGYATNLFESVRRGDINECSFGFVAIRQAWIDEPDPADRQRMRSIRELHDVDLFDVSVVTYPAYDGTTAGVSERALFPVGIPLEVRSHRRMPAPPDLSSSAERLTEAEFLERRQVREQLDRLMKADLKSVQ